MSRTAGEVFNDHLRLSAERRFDEDIEKNFAPDCVVLTSRGEFRGHDGLRELAQMLADELPEGEWRYETKLVAGRMAFLHWTVDSGDLRVDDGADSFLIEDGQVLAQTIHYAVRNAAGELVVDARGERSSGTP
jgi:hypothetical protein